MSSWVFICEFNSEAKSWFFKRKNLLPPSLQHWPAVLSCRWRRLAREIQRNTKFSFRTCQKSGISVLQHLLKILHSIVWLKIGGFDFAASSKFVLLAKPVQPPLPRSDIFTSSNLQCTKCNLSPGAHSSNTLFDIEGEKTTIPSHTYYLFQTILAPIKVKTVAE